MPSVRVKENENFEVSLRRFKRLCEKASVLSDLRRHEYYEKPTWKRKRKKASAIKRYQKKLMRETATSEKDRRK
ncbi:MAG: 30S ribosomal protein S21 [Gammaproteobacteria bacterium]|nr:30S ribosomal protein S21 [Gammaproteobacteria bacterium]